MKTSQKTLLSLPIKSESDVLLARRRTRQVASLLGFDERHQVRLSLALSEVVKYFLERAEVGELDFNVEDHARPLVLRLVVSGKALKQMQNKQSALEISTYLVSDCQVDEINPNESGSLTVRLGKKLHSRSQPFTLNELRELSNALDNLVTTSPIDEISQQNQELLIHLEKLEDQRGALEDLRANMEQKVRERTSQLTKEKNEMRIARDEAIRANELKSQFVANISHEIRTPMSGILGLAEELTEISESENVKELSSYILNAARDLMRTVNDLLDYSKMESAAIPINAEPFKIGTMVTRVMQTIQGQNKSNDLEIEEYIDPRLYSYFTGDSERIGQILLNLLNNAVKFTPRGRIDLRVKLNDKVEGTYFVQFEVEDTGIGIASENQDRLFQPFVQANSTTSRQFGGTGLGLAICKNLVEQMGGIIDFRSTSNKGSTFYFVLPLTLAIQ